MVAILSLFAVVTSLAVFAVPFAVNEKRATSQIQDDINALITDMVGRSKLDWDANVRVSNLLLFYEL